MPSQFNKLVGDAVGLLDTIGFGEVGTEVGTDGPVVGAEDGELGRKDGVLEGATVPPSNLTLVYIGSLVSRQVLAPYFIQMNPLIPHPAPHWLRRIQYPASVFRPTA